MTPGTGASGELEGSATMEIRPSALRLIGARRPRSGGDARTRRLPARTEEQERPERRWE
jgi:hypothetical protein